MPPSTSRLLLSESESDYGQTICRAVFTVTGVRPVGFQRSSRNETSPLLSSDEIRFRLCGTDSGSSVREVWHQRESRPLRTATSDLTTRRMAWLQQLKSATSIAWSDCGSLRTASLNSSSQRRVV